MERKYKMFKKRVVVATAHAAGIATISVPGGDVTINTVFLVHEVSLYVHLWGRTRNG